MQDINVIKGPCFLNKLELLTLENESSTQCSPWVPSFNYSGSFAGVMVCWGRFSHKFMLKDVKSDHTVLKFKFSLALAISLDSILQFSAKANVAARPFHKLLSWVHFSGMVFRYMLEKESISLSPFSLWLCIFVIVCTVLRMLNKIMHL